MNTAWFGNLSRGIAFAAGFVSRGSTGSGTLDEGFGAIVLGALLGAFIGLIAGMITNHFVKFCCFLCGKHLGGHALTVCITILGASVFAWLAACSGSDDGVASGTVEE